MEKKDSKNTVFYISLVIIAVMAVWSVALNESFTAASNAAFAFLTTDFGWLYLVSMIVFLIFVVYVAFGKYGRIRLGGETIPDRSIRILHGSDFCLAAVWESDLYSGALRSL